MNQSVLSVRVDSNDKKRFDEFCQEAGLNVSTAINMFIKTVIREQKIPFEVKTRNITDEEILEKIKEAEEEMKNGGKLYTAEKVHKIWEETINKNA